MKRKISFKLIFLLFLLLTTTTFGFLLIRAFFKPCTEIPIVFSRFNIPCFIGEIEEKNYLFELDLGMYGISMSKSEIQNLQKIEIGSRKIEDLFGNSYKIITYCIPSFKIKELEWNNVRIGEQDEQFLENITIYAGPGKKQASLNKKIAGSLGRHLLKKTNLLLDFPNDKMFACNSILTLKRKKYDIKKWLKVPFEETETGIILQVETDFGVKKLVFDTGCTLTALKSIEEENEKWNKTPDGLMIYHTSKFMIGNHNFVNRKLYRLNFSESFDEIDGLLGMNFIEDFQIYIDYPNRLIYINN